MNNSVAIKTNCYKGYDLDKTIAGIKQAGFRYVELSATPNNSSGISRFVPFNTLCDIKEKLNNNGLIPISLGGHTNIMDEDLVDDFIHNIKLARFFGCKYIVTSVGDPHTKEEGMVADEVVVEHINRFIPYLEEYDITLVIELHGNHCTGKILNNIVRSCNSNRIKINYDTANAIFYANFSNEELLNDIEQHIDLINYFHIKDKLGEKNEWNFPALGKGYVPFKEIFNILNKHNNNSLLCAEIEFTKDGPKDIEEINQAVLDSAKYLKENGFEL